MSDEPKYNYGFGPFRLDGVEHCLLRDGKYVPLAAQVFDILLMLVQHQGQLVTKGELMNVIWPDSFIEENNLTVRMSALRKVLGRDGKGRQYVETVHGRGYRFVVGVRRVACGYSPRAGTRGADGPGVAVPQEQLPDSLAVLPFEDKNGDPNLVHLADGITYGVVNSLSQLPQLKVMAPCTVSPYGGQDINPREIGRLLRVQAILVGRVFRLGGRVMVAVELVDVGNGSQIWGELYDRQSSDLFGSQAEIARDIAERVATKLRAKVTGADRQPTRLHPAGAETDQPRWKARLLLPRAWVRRTRVTQGREDG